MKTIHLLDWPEKQHYGETHVFHRWEKELVAAGIKVVFFDDHRHPRLQDTGCLILHSRYFKEWQNTATRNEQNREVLLGFLDSCKSRTDQLIWFDAADSTGAADLELLPYVDVMLKKQLMRDRNYYLGKAATPALRVWLNEGADEQHATFVPAAAEHLTKLRLGWNIGMNDYRYFWPKASRLSNYLPYHLHPLKFTQVLRKRPVDVVFRGTLPQHAATGNEVSQQRERMIRLLQGMPLNIACGPPQAKRNYLRELQHSKIGLSPFGWGEICYRDFEIMIAGSILIKPDMDHLESYPHVYLKNETYIPVRWDLRDLEEQMEKVINEYHGHLHLAIRAQEHYRRISADAHTFINHFRQMIS